MGFGVKCTLYQHLNPELGIKGSFGSVFRPRLYVKGERVFIYISLYIYGIINPLVPNDRYIEVKIKENKSLGLGVVKILNPKLGLTNPNRDHATG